VNSDITHCWMSGPTVRTSENSPSPAFIEIWLKNRIYHAGARYRPEMADLKTGIKVKTESFKTAFNRRARNMQAMRRMGGACGTHHYTEFMTRWVPQAPPILLIEFILLKSPYQRQPFKRLGCNKSNCGYFFYWVPRRNRSTVHGYFCTKANCSEYRRIHIFCSWVCRVNSHPYHIGKTGFTGPW